MPKQVQLRRGTTAQHSSFTGALAEITFDTTLNCLRYHDAATAGGFIVPKAAASMTTNGLLYATAGGTYTTTSNLTWVSPFLVITSGTDAGVKLNRTGNTNASRIQLQTSGTDDWAIGTRGTSDSDLHIFSFGTSDDVALFNRTSRLTTLYGGLTFNGAQTAQTSTGTFTIGSGGGNGNVATRPHGTGVTDLGNVLHTQKVASSASIQGSGGSFQNLITPPTGYGFIVVQGNENGQANQATYVLVYCSNGTTLDVKQIDGGSLASAAGAAVGATSAQLDFQVSGAILQARGKNAAAPSAVNAFVTYIA